MANQKKPNQKRKLTLVSQNELTLLYITCADMDSAETYARVLLEEKLIACANVFPKMSSLYWDQDEIKKTSETLLIVKTLKAQVPEVQKRLTSLHSYDTLCCIELGVDSVNSEFLSWVKTNLK